ncbi:PIN/TRAM domain-containing protein [Clostridium sp.]|uniref:PIN/TRAM domain-containing protein n=1 Tax=Clostridium sp. TaxID=1506 RepID=UPI00346433B9
MLRKVLRILFSVIGGSLGYVMGRSLLNIDYFSFFTETTFKMIIFYILSCLIFGLITFILFPFIYGLIRKLVDYVENHMQKLTAIEIIFGAVGAIIALIISSMIGSILTSIPKVGVIIYACVNIVAAIIGADLSVKKKDEIMGLFSSIKKPVISKEKKSKNPFKGTPKVLDTSVIIDGRIFDLCQTGFIEGTLIIPTFVLEELRHIADSSDGLKRNRGRRGLDVLNKIQKELNIDVEISEKDFKDIAEVDSKLLKLAQVLNGKVITNDYNLNKVAEFQGVPVLNINELANAIKPVVLPGEEMNIQIIKDGKESGQGISYLDDGTMIVVEGGRKYIGENLCVIVTSVLQTPAGRMIFAKKKD